MSNTDKSKAQKPWYKRWWVWVIAILLVAGIGNALSGGGSDASKGSVASSQETPTPTQSVKASEDATSAVFQQRFDQVCNAVKAKYQSIGSVSCQDAGTWQANHDSSPQAFPHEYQDINVEFGGQVSYEIKVIADPTAALEYFRGDYTCANISGGSGSCVVGEASPDMMFSVVTTQQNDSDATSIADGLRQFLETIS